MIGTIARFSGYDALGRVQGSTHTTSGQSYSMSYAYNLAGGLTWMTYPSGRVVSQTFDTAGRIAVVSSVKGNVLLITVTPGTGQVPLVQMFA